MPYGALPPRRGSPGQAHGCPVGWMAASGKRPHLRRFATTEATQDIDSEAENRSREFPPPLWGRVREGGRNGPLPFPAKALIFWVWRDPPPRPSPTRGEGVPANRSAAIQPTRLPWDKPGHDVSAGFREVARGEDWCNLAGEAHRPPPGRSRPGDARFRGSAWATGSCVLRLFSARLSSSAPSRPPRPSSARPTAATGSAGISQSRARSSLIPAAGRACGGAADMAAPLSRRTSRPSSSTASTRAPPPITARRRDRRWARESSASRSSTKRSPTGSTARGACGAS